MFRSNLRGHSQLAYLLYRHCGDLQGGVIVCGNYHYAVVFES